MNKKINTICFILLFFILVGIASASEDSDEALQTIKQPDVVKINVNSSDTVLSKSLEGNTPIQATSKNVLEAKKSTSKSKVTLKASDVKMYYGDGSKFKITLKNNKNSPMKNTKLKITINDKTYSKKTNDEGKILLAVNFDSGKYKVTTSYEGSDKYEKKSISNTITVKSTIKASDVSKYYKNKKSYTATFLDCNGKALKKTKVKYQLDKTVKSAKTNSKGEISFKINSKPGAHVLYLKNTKTGEVVARSVTVKNTIQHLSHTMTRDAMVSYSVKIVDGDGKALKNKKVTFIVANKKYSAKSDANGIATLVRNFDVGSHLIKSSYDGQEIGYQFEVYPISAPDTPAPEPQKVVKKTNFTHSISIPDYVNVTADYVFQNSKYSLKTGYNGIIKMPKNDVFKVLVHGVEYNFTNSPIEGFNSYILDGSSYLVPFDGSPVLHKYNRDNLIGEGILIYNENGSNIVEYKSSTESETDQFSMFLSSFLYGEAIVYTQNSKVKAQVTFFTHSYDNKGVNSNLIKLNSMFVYNLEDHYYVASSNGVYVRYAQNNKDLKFDYSDSVIPEQLTSEKINTKLFINGVEEFEKPEFISYGQDPNYPDNLGYEVMHSFAIVNEKVTTDLMDEWLSKNSSYVPKFLFEDIYGLFILGLETIWYADTLADIHAEYLNATWQRDRPTVILGGMNLKDIYLHILNADMGMNVTADNKDNEFLFRFINSVNLPKLEKFCISRMYDSNSSNATTSLEMLLNSIGNDNFSVVQMGDIFYFLSEDGTNSTVILNSSSGVAEVLLYGDNYVYKGAKVNTNCFWCNIVGSVHKVLSETYHMVRTVRNLGNNVYSFLNDKINPLLILGYQGLSLGLGIASSIAEGATILGASAFISVVGTMVGSQTIGIQVREHIIHKKDNYKAYDKFPLTRNGPLQYKKCFNIPQEDGTIHYVEVGVLDNFKLNRDDAVYITPSGTRKLTKKETYKYFEEDTWVMWTVPKKYQNYPVPF